MVRQINLLKPTLLISRAWIVLWVFLLSVNATAQDGSLSSSVDRSEIHSDESLNLIVTYQGKSNDAPDFRELEKDFRVYHRGQSSMTTRSFSGVEAKTEWTMVLEPKREGTLTIPPFTIGKSRSDTLEISVKPPAPTPAGSLEDVFLETKINKTEAYVQEQILLTFRLYFAVSVSSLEVDELNLPNTVIEAIPNTIYARRVSGKEYRVSEYTYALFPESSGELKIPALNWRVSTQIASNQRDFMGRPLMRTQAKRLRSDGFDLTIKAKPDNFPASAVWLPATELELEESWSSNDFSLGEPVTRTLTTRANGLRAVQLPEFLRNEDLGAIKFYIDQAQSKDDKTNQGFNATRIESAAVVINEPGQHQIPALRIPWWDTDDDTLKYAEVPAKNIQIAGDSLASTTAPEKVTQASASESLQPSPLTSESDLALAKQLRFFQLLSLVLFLASCTLLFLLWRNKHSGTQQDPKAKTVRLYSDRKIIDLCHQAEPQALRQTLLEWAQEKWPEAKLQALRDIAVFLNHDALSKALVELDTVIYSSNPGSAKEQWRGEELASALKDALKQKASNSKNEALAPLHP